MKYLLVESNCTEGRVCYSQVHSLYVLTYLLHGAETFFRI